MGLLKVGRTHDCGALRLEQAGEEVVLMGWVDAWRDLGGRRFIDLRDRGGVTQVVLVKSWMLSWMLRLGVCVTSG